MDEISVILVDDEPDVCSLLSAKLKREAAEFSIRTANSAAECLETIKSDGIDCILSDYQMPGMNGMELLEAVKELGLDIPFIFVTGQGSEKIASEAFRKGAYDYFTKDMSGFAFIPRMANSIRQSVIRRKWTADILRKTAEGVPFGSGPQFFNSLTRFMATSLQVDIAFIGALSKDGGSRIDTISVYAGDGIAQNFSYDLVNTPCATVIDNRPCVYPRNVQKLFPEDEMLVQMGLESYAGVPLYDSSGKPVGILVTVHSRPLDNEELVRTLLLILADRASAELERMLLGEEQSMHEGTHESIEELSQPMFIMESGYTVSMMNRAARMKIFGGERAGRNTEAKCHKLLRGLDEPCNKYESVKCPLDSALATGRNVKAVHDLMLPDGSLAETEITVSPMYSGTGEVSAAIGIFATSF